MGALDGALFSIPLSLGCVAILFGAWGAEALAMGTCATIVSLALLHAVTARSTRPVVFSARLFEATTLAAVVERASSLAPAWGLADTPGTRLAFLCLVSALAGVFIGLLYAARADRLTRFIPTPVFVGFANATACAMIISQTKALWGLASGPGHAATPIAIALITAGTALAIRRWRPQWSAPALGLLAGTLAGLLALTGGESTARVAEGATATWSLPLLAADWRAPASPDLPWASLGATLVPSAAILAVMMFINTTVTTQAISHLDERPEPRSIDHLMLSAATVFGGALGGAPLAGSTQASTMALRSATDFSPRLMLLCGALLLTLYATGAPGWVPLAAIAGGLLGEAYLLIDRRSLLYLRDWARGQPLPSNAGEDLALIAAVTVSAVLFNTGVAVLVGLMLGVTLFAVRHARSPVHAVWTGLELRSNCARSRTDLERLTAEGRSMRVVELQGDLFFGAAHALTRALAQPLAEGKVMVVDWSGADHVDTSVVQAMQKFERQALARGVPVVHAGARHLPADLRALLFDSMQGVQLAPDLDHALELAENHLLMHTDAPSGDAEGDALLSLYAGLSPDEVRVLQDAMPEQRFSPGEALLTAGGASDAMMLVLEGSASVFVPAPGGGRVRLAGVRRGATVGEMGFLDAAPRSATVEAQTSVCAAVLTRAAYEQLAREHPAIVQRLLTNLALALAARVRSANQLATARQRRHP